MQNKNRTKLYFAQLKGTVIYKVLALAASFLIVPIMLNYLGVELYGVWSTLLSIIMWIVYFDLGIGNGMRNKVGVSLAKNKTTLARKYISTAYIVLSIFSFTMFCLFLFVKDFVDWQTVFNTVQLSSNALGDTVTIVLFFILLHFVLSLAIQIYFSIHKSEMSVFYQFFFNWLVLATTTFLYFYTETNMLLLAAAYGISMLIAILCVSYLLFNKHKKLIPSFYYFDKTKIKSLFGVGSQFFIIQLSLLIILSTDKIIITQLFGPAEVSYYDILFKLFTIILILHNLIMSPMWSSFTDAYTKNDIRWIKKTLKNLNYLMLPFIILVAALIITAPYIISMWIGKEFNTNQTLIYGMGMFSIFMIWNNIYGNFSNGISRMKVQLISYLVGAVINIPLSIFFGKYIFEGVEGVIFASIVSLSIFSFAGPIFTHKVVKEISGA